MRTWSRLVIALVLVLSVASPALAQVATIQAAAPLADHSEESVRASFTRAVQTAVRAAVTMGLPWVRLSEARVFEDAVVVQIVASDTEADEDEPGESGPEEGSDAAPRTQL